MPDLRHGTIDTVLGELTLVANGDNLRALYFPGHWHLPASSTFGAAIDATNDEFFQTVKVELDEYLAGQRAQFTVALQPQGNDFSQEVWSAARNSIWRNCDLWRDCTTAWKQAFSAACGSGCRQQSGQPHHPLSPRYWLGRLFDRLRRRTRPQALPLRIGRARRSHRDPVVLDSSEFNTLEGIADESSL